MALYQTLEFDFKSDPNRYILTQLTTIMVYSAMQMVPLSSGMLENLYSPSFAQVQSKLVPDVKA